MIACLRILPLKRDGKRVQLRRHQPTCNVRIFSHELSRCVFVGRLKDRDAKGLVAWVLMFAPQESMDQT